MTAQELLRAVADRIGKEYQCNCGGGDGCRVFKDTIAIRALADRFDDEARRARASQDDDRYEGMSCEEIELELLDRLDADLG